MFTFVIFMLGAMGMTLIVTQGEIFRTLREAIQSKSSFFGKLISCPMCFGVYAGWFVQALILWSTDGQPKLYHVLYGFINSLCSYSIVLLLNTIESVCIHVEKRNEVKSQLY